MKKNLANEIINQTHMSLLSTYGPYSTTLIKTDMELFNENLPQKAQCTKHCLLFKLCPIKHKFIYVHKSIYKNKLLIVVLYFTNATYE